MSFRLRGRYCRVRLFAALAWITTVGFSSPPAVAVVSFSGDVTLGTSTTIGNTGLGTFRIDGGSTHTSNSVQIGSQTNGIGFATVTGAGSQWNLTSSGSMDVGSSGIGRLDILAGGVVSLTQTGQFRIAANNTSSGAVTVDGPGSLLNINSSLSLGSSVTTSGSALLRISNGAIANATAGQSQISPLGRVELNDGLLRVSQLANSGAIIGSGEVLIQSTSSTTNSGRFEARAGDLLRITGPGTGILNQGIITADGGEIEFARPLTNLSTGPVLAEITLRNGIIRVGSPSASVPQLGNTAVLAAIGGVNDLYGRIMNDTNGRIAVTNHSVMTFHDDVEANDGVITVFPGSSAVFLEDLTVGEQAELLADLAGTDDDTGFGTIEVVGTADLAGALTVTLAGGFTPAAGNTFALLAAGGISGALSLGDTPDLPAALAWDLDVDAHRVVLSVIPALAGDYNVNGTVDAADYVVWRKTNGHSGFGLVADGNDDGTVNDADYSVWRANFGNTLAGAATTALVVPEPGTFCLVPFAVLALRRVRFRAPSRT